MIGFGWRWMFVFMGIAGLAVAALWFLLYRDAAEEHCQPKTSATT